MLTAYLVVHSDSRPDAQVRVARFSTTARTTVDIVAASPDAARPAGASRVELARAAMAAGARGKAEVPSLLKV